MSGSGIFEENDEACRYLLAYHKRVKEKSWKTCPDSLERCSYWANQIDLVCLVREHPEIHAITAVLGGHGAETGKRFNIFCESKLPLALSVTKLPIRTV